MAAQGGFGLELKIAVSSTLTAIVGVTTASFPAFRKYLAESTSHGSEDGYYESVATGKRRIEAFSADINWDINEATHAAVLTGFDSDDPVSMSIEDPDGDEVIAFSAHIEAITRISEQEDRYYATVEIHPTGPATIS